jgi:AcrR family transcriptional regulator
MEMLKRQSGTISGRLPHGRARGLIIDAAEILFSKASIDSVSFRDLANEAGVSLSAIHYHFGSKEGVLKEVFARRAEEMVRRRDQLLDALERDAQGKLPLEGIIDAFVRPALEVTRGDRNDLFNRLLVRLSVEASDVARDIISRAFDKNDLRFIDEIEKALPHLTRADIHWRFHFFVGAMIYTMSDAGQLSGLSGGECNASETDVALSQLTTAFIGAFPTDPGMGQLSDTAKLEFSALIDDRV